MSLPTEQRRADQLLDSFAKHPGTVTRAGVGGGKSALTPASAQSLVEAVNQRAQERGMQVKTWIENTTPVSIVCVQHIDGE
jgi:hypothetical protein